MVILHRPLGSDSEGRSSSSFFYTYDEVLSIRIREALYIVVL